MKRTYGEAIRDGFAHLMSNNPEVFVIGQGLWSPWYVGNSMTDLDRDFGRDRVIDTPVSESAVTGAAIGASLVGSKAIVVHPRMDFMMYAMDAIINEAAKWRHMTGGNASPAVTIRSIINRGGEQGAQHSQALHSFFCHVPGLTVLMPSNPQDAFDMLVAAGLSDGPVIYIDDRWLYEEEGRLEVQGNKSLSCFSPRISRSGEDLTYVAFGYGVKQATDVALIAAEELGLDIEVIDVRKLSPLNIDPIVDSVKKTGRIFVSEIGWENSSLGSYIVAEVMKHIDIKVMKASPFLYGLPPCPAPCAKGLEMNYYRTNRQILNKLSAMRSS